MGVQHHLEIEPDAVRVRRVNNFADNTHVQMNDTAVDI